MVGNWLAVLAGCGVLTGESWAYTITNSSGSTAYTVSSSDLLQTHLRSAESALILYPEKGYLNGTLETLTDGTAAIASDGRLNAYALSGGTVVYTLDTVLHPSGYDISSVATYSGWQDTGRVNQHYEVAFRMVGSNTFDNVITVSYTGTAGQTCVAIADINLTGVEAIRFTFLSQQNGGVGYKELDVIGAPTAFTDMSLSAETQMIASNSVANVRIVGDGVAAGTFDLDSPVTIIDTLTHSATGGVATLDPAGQTLKVNRLFVQPKAVGLAVGTGSGNGIFAGAEEHLYFDVAGTNEATIHSSITNGNFSGSLFKRGSGTLTLDGSNPYSGDTVVNAGTLKLTGSGSLGRGALRVQDARLRIEGGSAYAKREVIFTNAAIEQTAGSLRSDNNIQVQNTTLDLLGGSSFCKGSLPSAA